MTTDENTTVTNENGDPNPVLGNDEKVRVKGVFDGVKQAVLASEITILNGTGSGNGGGGNSGGGNSGGGSEQERSYRASGPGSNFSADAGTFDLTIKDADGFKPEKLKVGIVTTADTVFSGDSGVKLTKEEFFAKATEGAGVGVQGNFGPGVTSVTATQVRLLNDPDNKNHAPREFSLRGPLSHIERSAQTFALKVKEFEGVPFAPNTDIWIIVDENTKYGTADAPLTATEFFAGAELNKGYEMRGVLDATTRRLKALWVRPAARLDQK